MRSRARRDGNRQRVAKFGELQMGALRALVKEIEIAGAPRLVGREAEGGGRSNKWRK
jgi:hypothetical protein